MAELPQYDLSTQSAVLPAAASLTNAATEVCRAELPRPGTEYVIDAAALQAMLGQKALRIVDVRPLAQCPDGHIPGAVQLDYSRLIRQTKSAQGLLPRIEEISSLLGELAIGPDDFVVAYDDDSGIEAARLLWTLEVIGHRHYALLNGGFAAWDEAEFETAESPVVPQPVYRPVSELGWAIADMDDVFQAIGNPEICIVDTRSAAEYAGEVVRARRGGHIPGAVHFDWVSAVDIYEDGMLRDPLLLWQQLQLLGVTTQKEIIVYCQSNRRSSHTFLVLKWLGFENIRAYTGSWSEWGNHADTPVE